MLAEVCALSLSFGDGCSSVVGSFDAQFRSINDLNEQDYVTKPEKAALS